MCPLYLLLGANLGNRANTIAQALHELAATVGAIKATSSLYETAPWGKGDQPLFYNKAVQLQTTLDPAAVWQHIQAVEQKLGKVSKERWGPRRIDIDILYYHKHIITNANLTIPHKALPRRKFVLVPLCEIAPNYIHPVLQKTNKVLLLECPDPLKVQHVRA